MKLLFFGNCQSERAARALSFFNEDHEFLYAGSSKRVGRFDPSRTERLMDEADHVVAQAILNERDPNSQTALIGRLGDKVTFTPYVFVDGLYSLGLSMNTEKLLGGVVGSDILREAFDAKSQEDVLKEFDEGTLDFRHAERLKASLQELERREAPCDIKVSPMIREMCLKKRIMITHNHPHPSVISLMCHQIAQRLSLKWDRIDRTDPLKFALITLPEHVQVLSPYTVADLGAEFPYDLQWRENGIELIKTAHAAWVDERRSRHKSRSKSKTNGSWSQVARNKLSSLFTPNRA